MEMLLHSIKWLHPFTMAYAITNDHYTQIKYTCFHCVTRISYLYSNADDKFPSTTEGVENLFIFSVVRSVHALHFCWITIDMLRLCCHTNAAVPCHVCDSHGARQTIDEAKLLRTLLLLFKL